MGRNSWDARRGGLLFLCLLLVAVARTVVPEGLRRLESALLVVPGHVLRQVLLLWQPGTVIAASRGEPDSGAALAEAVRRRLYQRAQPPAGLLAGATLAAVCEVRASTAGRRPDLLVLDLAGGQGGELVVSGDVLVGFLAAPRPDRPAVVELLSHLPPAGSRPRRVLATARPEGGGNSAADEVLRFVVEPAAHVDPFPLHVVKPDRPHVNTWRRGVDFVARTLALPGDTVPEGLRLGRVRTHGYLAPDHVLDWYLEPEVDARVLHTVAVLPSTAATPLTAVANTERVPVRALGRFVLAGGRELLLITGSELEPGCAVVAGERLLGRVVGRAGPVTTVRPFGDPGQVWPAVLWEESAPGPCDVLLEPVSSRSGQVRCRVRPARLDQRLAGSGAPHADPEGPRGVLFTGPVSATTPTGLLLGECRFVGTDELEVQAAALERVPRQLHAVRARAGAWGKGR